MKIEKDKKSVTIWVDYNPGGWYEKSISISWMRPIWGKNGVGQKWMITDNGGRKENGDNCLDKSIFLGYLVLGYVNWNLQG